MFEYSIWGVVVGTVFASIFYFVRSRIVKSQYAHTVQQLKERNSKLSTLVNDQTVTITDLVNEIEELKGSSGDRLQQPKQTIGTDKQGSETQSTGKRKGNARSRTNPTPRTKPKSASRKPKPKTRG